MVGLRSYQVILQRSFLCSDTKWDYRVPNLPGPAATNTAGLVKSISFVSSLKTQHAQLKLETAPSNRITRSEPLDRFLLLAFADFRLREVEKSGDGRVLFAPAGDSSDYLARLLKSGIVLNGVHYNFFGHSNSQLKSRSCFLFAATKEEISGKVEGLGDFSKMKSISKKAKRIGLLFSSAEIALTLDPDRCEDIDDVTHNGYTFTDGCGLISTKLAREIVQKRKIVYRNKRYLPAVFQIRYRGYKGVLTLCPGLKGTKQVSFRKSMRKFTDVKDHSFAVVEYSKPYSFGYLNDEVVLLLHALGVTTQTLLRKQAEYLAFLKNVSDGDLRAAFQFLSFRSETTLAQKLLLEGIEVMRDSLRSLVGIEYSKMLSKRKEQRCRIMVIKSRLLFGVCDPTRKDLTDGNSPPGTIDGKLRPGTCFVRITSDGDGEARTLINTEVLVTRNPCLHPGDLQKFKVVDVPEFAHLVDCIVFPVRGSRPSADLMSGGDLDGDKFFVTWDPDIIPRVVSQPAAYPGVKERTEFRNITDDDRAEFFAKYNSASLGRIKNLYMKWARLKGSMCPECQELNRLFSQCVDGNRVKVPPKLEDPKDPAPGAPSFILDDLHETATRMINDETSRKSDFRHYPEDMLDLLSSRDNIAISEFELIQFILEACGRTNRDFVDYAPFFNYSALTDEEQAWLLQNLPATKETPSLVRNGMLQSLLVHPVELSTFKLDSPNLRWKPIYNSSRDRLGRFLHVASRSLELYHKKMIVIQADERLTLMIYLPHKVPKASETQVDTAVRVFALPHSSGSGSVKYRVMPTKVDYRLYCDDNVFQLYESKRANTWIYLTRGPLNESSSSEMNSKGDRRRQLQRTIENGVNYECRASVALDKISGPIQKHVGKMNRSPILAAEIYAISNRDIGSMRFLDEWLQYIDTEEVLPLFEATLAEYRLPTLQEIDQEALPRSVGELIFSPGLEGIRSLTDPGQIKQILHLLHNAGQNTRLLQVYTRLLDAGVSQERAKGRASLIHTLMDFLQIAPFLTQTFLESQFWASFKDLVEGYSDNVFLELLGKLVLSMNRFGILMKQPFLLLLKQLKQISFQRLSELFELVALSVEQAEFAVDLLIDCVGSECIRLLIGTPVEIQQFINSITGIALEHIDQVVSNRKLAKQYLTLCRDGMSDGFEAAKASLRIDSPEGALRIGDHVHFIAAKPPQNAPLQRPYEMDAIVIKSEQGSATFRCLHPVPVFLADCSWGYRHCGSFVTSKAMFDAVTTFYAGKDACCRLYGQLVGLNRQPSEPTEQSRPIPSNSTLNPSQKEALRASLDYPLTFLWGPPGTGKTHTVVTILKELIKKFRKFRFLVTAPTHNAVDNVLQYFIDDTSVGTDSSFEPLRVSNNLSKVSATLRQYTCDAMVGKDLSEGHAGRREAQRRVKKSMLIFTTCAGAGLGLLRSEEFDIVIIDEASQQTEPETLIPLTKGCRRAILVGDHVQLRATVQKHAILSGFDISLFERRYTMPEIPGVAKVMLDTQYRMHPDICHFSSGEFYDSRLKSADEMAKIAIVPSQFPWPDGNRKVFIQCASPEDIGRQSKSNKGQVQICREICRLLSAAPATGSKNKLRGSNDYDGNLLPDSIAVLTPYSQQRKLLQDALPMYTVSSIDGFQGREVDVVIFVTVRCNMYYDIGFLKDLRRLNVAMTRAKAGVIIIGDRMTLTGRSSDDADDESKNTWKRLLNQCTEVNMEVV